MEDSHSSPLPVYVDDSDGGPDRAQLHIGCGLNILKIINGDKPPVRAHGSPHAPAQSHLRAPLCLPSAQDDLLDTDIVSKRPEGAEFR